MAELAPYHFRPEELPDVLQNNLLRTEVFAFRGERYRYGIIAPEAIHAVPNFTGMWKGQNLMVSMDVVLHTHLRTVTLSHEILCNRLYAALPNHSCPAIENEVLAPFEPFPTILAEMIRERLRMFTALIPFNKIDPHQPKNHLEEGIVGTWKYLDNLAKGKRIAVDQD